MNPGDFLGPYQIKERLGTGSMGEVYRAHDPRLNREVAVKVLPADFAADAERLARFEREARAIAAIDHPSIVVIHSVEQAGDIHFITTQLIEGQTLNEVLPPGGVPLERFFELAIPLADAVAAAHARGITHRDLKPGNVMVTADGRVKVVDFGLAKLREPDGASGAQARIETTLGSTEDTLTQKGVILGTVEYMAPEQAEGRPVDARADIFSLGVMLYEMATGTRPFDGDTKMSALLAILQTQPVPITQRNPMLPRQLERIVDHALEKDRERRFQSAKDIRNELEQLREEVRRAGQEAGAVGEAGTPPAGGANRPALAVAAAVIAVAGLAAGYWLRGPAPAPPGGDVWLTEQLTYLAGIETTPALSPDGETVVYAGDAAGNFDLYTQRVDGVNAFNLTASSPGYDGQPSFSTDGARIVFRSDRDGGGLFIMGATGEQVRKLADEGFSPAFSPDGRYVAASTFDFRDPLNLGDGDLLVFDVESGERRALLTIDYYQPRFSPDGRRIAVTGAPGGQRDIYTVPADGGEPVAVTDDASLDWSPAWSPDGRFLYFASDRGGGASGIWRVAIDARTGGAVGDPEQVTTSESMQGFLSMSEAGDEIVYASRRDRGNVQRVAFDPAALTLAGDPVWVTGGSRVIWSVSLAPDDQRMVVATKSPLENLYTMRVDGSEPNQITNDAFRIRKPRWSPDGETVLYYGNRDGAYEIWAVAPTGGSPRKLVASTGGILMDPVWSPDGLRVSVYERDVGSFIVDAASDPATQQWERLPALEPVDGPQPFRAEDWSPDGARLAGVIEGEEAKFAVYDFTTRTYRIFDSPGDSPDDCPRWLPDSRRFIGITGARRDRLVLVDAQTGEIHELLSVAPDVLDNDIDLSSDGRWIYLSRRQAEADLYVLRRSQ